MPLFAIAKGAAVAGMMSVALVQAADAAVSCTNAARHLVTLVRDNWPSSNDDTPAAIGDMLSAFRHKSASGFVPGTTRFQLEAYSKQDFIKQASLLPRPFVPSRELLGALDGGQQALVVSDLPGSDLFAANSIGGTANCNSTVFFAVDRARAAGAIAKRLGQRRRRRLRADAFVGLGGWPSRCYR